MLPAQGSNRAHAKSFRNRACALLVYGCVLSKVAVAVRLDVSQGGSHTGSHEYGFVADTFADQLENRINHYDYERGESRVASSSIPHAKTESFFNLPKKTFPLLSSTGDGKLTVGKGTAALIGANSAVGSGKHMVEGGPGGTADGGDPTVGTASAIAASQAAETMSKLVGELQLRVPVSEDDLTSLELGNSGSDALYNHNVETERILPASEEPSKDIRATVPLPTSATVVGNSKGDDTDLDRNSSVPWNSVAGVHEREVVKERETPSLGSVPRDNDWPAGMAHCRGNLIAASHVLDHLEHDCGSARNQEEADQATTEANPSKVVMDAVLDEFRAASGDFSFASSLLDDAHVLSRDIAETDFGSEMKNDDDAFRFEKADEEEEVDAYDVDAAKEEAVMPESVEKHVRWEDVAIREALRGFQNGLWDRVNPGRSIVQGAVETEASLRKRLRAYQALRNGADTLLKKTNHASSNLTVKDKLLSIAVGDTCHKKLMTWTWLKQEVRERCPGSSSLSAASLAQLESYIEEEVDVDGAAGARKSSIPSDLPSGLLQHASMLELQMQSHQRKDEQLVKLLPNASDAAGGTSVVENTSVSSVFDTRSSRQDDGWPLDDWDNSTVDVMTYTELFRLAGDKVPPSDAARERIKYVLSTELHEPQATPPPTPRSGPTKFPTPSPTHSPTLEPTQADTPRVLPPSNFQSTTDPSDSPSPPPTTTDSPPSTTTESSSDGDGSSTTEVILTRRHAIRSRSLASRHASEEYHRPGYEALLRTAVDRLQKDRFQNMRIDRRLHNRDREAETGEAADQEPDMCNAMTCDRECSVQQGAQFQTSTCRSRVIVHQETKSLKEAVDVVNKKCYKQCCCTMMEVKSDSSLRAPPAPALTQSASVTADYETTVKTGGEVPAYTLMNRDELLSQIQPLKDDGNDADVSAQEQDQLLDTDAWAGSSGSGKGRTRAVQKRSMPTVLSTHARKHRHQMRRKSRPEVHRKKRRSRQSSLDVKKFGNALATALLATQEDANAPDSNEKERLAYIQEFLALTDMTDSTSPRRASGKGIVRNRVLKADDSASLLDQPMNAGRSRPAEGERVHAALPAELETVEWCNSRRYLLDEIRNDLRVRCPQAVIEDSSLGEGLNSVVSGDQCLARENRFEELLNHISAECSECPKVKPGRCDENCAGRSPDGVDFVSTCRSLAVSVSLDGPQGMPIETAICDVNRLCAPQCGCSKQDFLDDTSSNAGEI